MPYTATDRRARRRALGRQDSVYVRYMPTLDQIFPSAQFVHMIRDGRDAALSAREKWPDRRRYMDHYYLLKNWVRNVDAGQKAGHDLGPDRYLEVRYERLVQDPQPVLEEICSFLARPFQPAMLDHVQLAAASGPAPRVTSRYYSRSQPSASAGGKQTCRHLTKRWPIGWPPRCWRPWATSRPRAARCRQARGPGCSSWRPNSGWSTARAACCTPWGC